MSATETTHRCPPEGETVTPCCGRTPFELPVTDRITLDPALVTCHRHSWEFNPYANPCTRCGKWHPLS